MKPNSELAYVVTIYRRDNEHLIVHRLDDFSKAKELWKGYQDLWVQSHKEQIPFILDGADILCDITCFDPSLIKEIKLEPVTNSAISAPEENPYMKRMMQQGFAKSFQNPEVSTGLLDSGYKY